MTTLAVLTGLFCLAVFFFVSWMAYTTGYDKGWIDAVERRFAEKPDEASPERSAGTDKSIWLPGISAAHLREKPDEAKPCPKCDGSGAAEGPEPGWYERDCPSCKGTGTKP